MSSDYDRIGESALRAILADFIDREREDLIIGFFFEGRDRDRILQKEFELAAAQLGGPQTYTGRPLAAVHKPLRINRGQFRRRLAILRRVLEDHGVEPDIQERWIAHDQALLDQITIDEDCVD